jgi:hypothetical protein
MTIVLSAPERNALYQRILLRLNGIDAVYTAIAGEDWDAAARLGEEFSDLLRLVCTDLGWGESGQDETELSTPPDVLRRAASDVRALAEDDLEHYEAERQQAEGEARRVRSLKETCERILDALD